MASRLYRYVNSIICHTNLFLINADVNALYYILLDSIVFEVEVLRVWVFDFYTLHSDFELSNATRVTKWIEYIN